MNRRTLISALSLVPFVRAATGTSVERKKFIGMWKLVGGEAKDQVTGEVSYPWGKNPFGRLLYDKAGRVFVQLMNPGRKSVGGAANRGAAVAIGSSSADDMR